MRIAADEGTFAYDRLYPGGCSPIGMKKHFPTYVHETAAQYDYVYVSAGQRGLQVKLSPRDLLHEARAEYADLIAL